MDPLDRTINLAIVFRLGNDSTFLKRQVTPIEYTEIVQLYIDQSNFTGVEKKNK